MLHSYWQWIVSSYGVLRPLHLKAAVQVNREPVDVNNRTIFGSFYPKSSDGWAFTNNMDIKQHQTLGDRLSAARVLVDLQPRCPVVVDDMTNVATSKYAALPERLFVLQAGKVVYKVGRGSSAPPSSSPPPPWWQDTGLESVGGDICCCTRYVVRFPSGSVPCHCFVTCRLSCL